MATTKRRFLTQRELLIEAGKALHGDVEWMAKFAKTIGVSRQLASAMLSDEPTRPITNATESKVLGALIMEADRLRRVADRLEDIAALIAIKKEK